MWAVGGGQWVFQQLCHPSAMWDAGGGGRGADGVCSIHVTLDSLSNSECHVAHTHMQSGLWLPLGLAAPVITPNSVSFLFFSTELGAG